MLRAFAHFYIYIGRVFQYWIQLNKTGQDRLDEGDYQYYRKHLEELVSHCKAVKLTTSETLIRDSLARTTSTFRYLDASQKMGELQRCVEAELKSKFFFFIPPERARYLILLAEDEPSPHIGEEMQRFTPLIQKFRSIVPDLEDAGNCYATGSFTACVYHLMRVCEYGLASLAANLGTDPGVSSWEKLLRKMSNKIAENDATHPEGWEDDRSFYSETATLMINVKNSWRNSVSHIRKHYDEPRARRVFNSVEALMQHLSSRLSEVPLPAASTLADPESAPSASPPNQ